jgi:hypothetical protein
MNTRGEGVLNDELRVQKRDETKIEKPRWGVGQARCEDPRRPNILESTDRVNEKTNFKLPAIMYVRAHIPKSRSAAAVSRIRANLNAMNAAAKPADCCARFVPHGQRQFC